MQNMFKNKHQGQTHTTCVTYTLLKIKFWVITPVVGKWIKLNYYISDYKEQFVSTL